MNDYSNYFIVPNEVKKSPQYKDLSSSAKVLYVELCSLKNMFETTEREFWRSTELLSEDTGLDRKTIFKAKKELVASGLLEVYRGAFLMGKRQADWYQVLGFTQKELSTKNTPYMVPKLVLSHGTKTGTKE